MPARELRSVAELTTEVKALFDTPEARWWFRGHRQADWDLLPSVHREYSPEEERYLTNDFRPRAATRYANPPEDDDYAGWLALMQHYGLPTRMLDWTRSPLIAAYFATELSQPHSKPRGAVGDACIWALSPKELNVANGLKPLVFPLRAESLEKFLKPAIKEPRTPDSKERVVAAVPSETDLRMVLQQGAFTVHTTNRSLTDFDGASRFLRQFRIPADAQLGMADELALLGLRLGDLFPDLTNLAREIVAKYRPNPVVPVV